MGVTFTVNRIALKKMLTVLGVGEKSIDEFLASLNKMHKHANVIAFAGMLQNVGLKSDSISNVMRRIGVDDITIANVLNTLDEDRIKKMYGKIVEISIE